MFFLNFIYFLIFFIIQIKNSPYCEDYENKNYNFLLFDVWENEKNKNRTDRDQVSDEKHFYYFHICFKHYF